MNRAQELQYLQMKELARDALTAYCLALDSDDLGLLSSIMHPDAVLNRPPDQPVIGRPAIVDFFRAALEEKVDSRRHFVTNPVVAVADSVHAHVTSYFFALHYKDGALSFAWGEYKFDVIRDGESALVSGLQIHLDMPIAPLRSLLEMVE